MLFLKDRIAESIQILKEFEPPDGYYLAFSGGKDSVVLFKMAQEARVQFDAHYHYCSCDMPELVKFIREHYPEVSMDKPDITMWQLIVKKQYPPTRVQRYCCEYLKERGGEGRVVLTGVKRADSVKRKQTLVSECRKKGTIVVHPLLNWSDEEIWSYIYGINTPYCSLYDEGWKRLGCVGCPLIGPKRQKKEFERWPKFKEAYLRAFGRMNEARIKNGKKPWKDAEEVMSWWLNDPTQKPD